MKPTNFSLSTRRATKEWAKTKDEPIKIEVVFK